MKPTRNVATLTALVLGLLTFGLAGAAGAATDAAAGGSTPRALYCVGIPYIYYGGTTVYPGGEVCVPGP
jgi:hypothetical protein